MRRLGVDPVPILSGPLRRAALAPGRHRQHHHCAGYRAAAVSVQPGAVGIDAEPDAPLPPGVLEVVSLPREREMLLGLAALYPRTSWDRLLFSAKESVYKAWFPLAGRWLDFQDAAVSLDPERGTFRAELLVPGPRWMGRPLTGFSGRWRTGAGLIVTAVAAVAAPHAVPPARRAGRKPQMTRFGVVLIAEDCSRNEWAARCRRAEALATTWIAVPDHLNLLAPFPTALLAAEVTERALIGTYVLNAAFHRPALLARDVVTLNRLMDGRLELGLGTGYVRAEFEAAGLPFGAGTRTRTLERLVAELDRLLEHKRPPLMIAGTATGC
ncbi:LLM class flavin-dependent oxidoreductase [Nonomuraea dietziae]|uniref:LLM class flavin-dependent oxidoreductase n=1 Tax=Nonomuraea dietziae TaxID=65515 RepID=UPI0031D3F74A